MTQRKPHVKFNLVQIEEAITDILNSNISDGGLDDKRKRFEEAFRNEIKRLIK